MVMEIVKPRIECVIVSEFDHARVAELRKEGFIVTRVERDYFDGADGFVLIRRS
jgi:hypothetical protein